MTAFFFFFLIIPCANPLHFNLPYIVSNDSLPINCTGDAYISIQGIQVTPDPNEYYSNSSSLKWKVGRATYNQPLWLWDKASGKLTDFSTHFSFVIQGNNYGEGLAFFLAPNGSNIPSDSAGGGLGLVSGNQTGEFVAVKFDTYRNTWEEGIFPINYVGININSRTSVENKQWLSAITDGKTNEAWISYSSSTKNLSVVFTGFENNDVILQHLDYIVDLSAHLPEWVTFGFSASTSESYEKHSVKSWNFSSSLGDDRDENKKVEEKSKTGLVVGLSVGGGVLVIGVALICFGVWKKGRGRKKDELRPQSMDEEFKKGTGARKFSYEELSLATKNFAEEEKLGMGGFGGVYRGFLSELNSFVAVKRVSSGSKQGLKEYAAEVKIISQLRHRNLVQLIGWCHEKGELLLVYEFLPNGSLDSHLFKSQSLLTWGVRYKIAQGLASALFYLHEEWEQCVVHRDIKSSNIMLDSNFNAKLGDFGLARLVDHEQEAPTTDVAGTRGYMAPEYLITGKASKESDVYSFGVVALEIACGRRPIESKAQQNQINMVEWVWELYGTGRLFEAADARLSAGFDEQQMEHLMIVGLWCANPDYLMRPTIRQSNLVLNFEAPLPILPTEMPPLNLPGSSFSSSYYGIGSGSSQVQSSIHSDNSNNSSKLLQSSQVSSLSSSYYGTDSRSKPSSAFKPQ
ncbi:Legume lectin domain protein [Actinidia chinensis var. chinensis]|uniref:Legume lectin domain protein n=1 Tax=Actinidia chinensis var. chinensis TaxID=1590841 RepID=A0A2R6Q697_ACTCC|nr:Legume lectin domain protein [Actinidia chinensis var. chinensis]